MIATVKLYKSTKILEEKAFMVDSLKDYLNSLSNTLVYTINYFKFDKLEPTLKLPLREENIEMLGGNDYNYLEITNAPTTDPSNTKTYYYFITNKIWKSENCVEFSLKLDTVNTFKWNTDYKVSARTKVLREHRDRYQKITPKNILVEGHAEVTTRATHLPALFEETYTYYDDRLITGETPTIEVILDNEEADYSTYLDTEDGTLAITISTFGSAQTVGFEYSVFISSAQTLCRKVDAIPEGINPILYKGKEENIIQAELDTSWNLIYKNQGDIEPSEVNQVNPVECYACPDTPLVARIVGSSRQISYSSLTEGTYYFIGGSNNDSIEINYKDNADNEYNTSYTSNSVQGSGITINSSYIVLYRGTGNSYFTVYYYQYVYSSWRGAPTIERTTLLKTATNITSIDILSNIEKVYYTTSLANDFAPNTATKTGSFTFSTSNKYVSSLEGVDRTDSKLIKIFKLPYSPSKVSFNGNNVVLDENWDFDDTSSLFKLKNLNSKFNYTFEAPIKDPTENLNVPFNVNNISLFQARNINIESKLFNSEFYSPRVVYDSFAFNYALEKVDISKYKGLNPNGNFVMGFVMTTTINSKFMFYFPNYELINFLKSQDYDKYMPIARNNEVVLYTNQYINYIRTGYNYDVKAKDRTQATSGLGLGLGITGSLASMGLAVASGNPAVMVGGIIGGISSIVSNVVSTINTISSSEMAISSKLEQLKNNATSVAGSDDIDLLEVYSNNRAKLTEWRCSENMRKAIYDLFYYCGYATNEMKVPTLTTRKWFNFIQAELEINENNNFPDFVVNDLIEKFKNGITVLHMNKDEHNTKIWDFNQEYENWEDTLIETD